VDDGYQGEMRFTVQQRPGQEPVLLAEGVIDQNVIPRLEAALDQFRGSEIWIRSPGGYVGVDREAGIIIRQRGLNTRVPAGWTCSGACNFMFMGGFVRTVDVGGHFVVRMFVHTGDLSNFVEIGRSSLVISTEDNDYLIRMGVSRRLLTEVMYRDPARSGSPGYCMTPEELAAYNVTNFAVAGPARRP
jgi:hypothetical protein